MIRRFNDNYFEYNIVKFIGTVYFGNLIHINTTLPFNVLSKRDIGNESLDNESPLNINHNLKFGCQLSFDCSNIYSVSYRK